MEWKIIFLLFMVLTIVVCEEDDSDDNYYDEKKFHIQGRQLGDSPHCIVRRRRRSFETQSDRKNFNNSSTLTSPTASGSQLQIVTGHQMIENPTIIPTGFAGITSPTGTGIISPTVTDTGSPTGISRPGVTIPTGTATAPNLSETPTTYPYTSYATSPDRNTGTRDKYNKRYKKIRNNKRISKINDHSIEKIGTGVNMNTKTDTGTKTGTRSATVTTTKTDAGSGDSPSINCIIVNRPTTPAPGISGILGNLFNLRRRRSLRNIHRKFGLN